MKRGRIDYSSSKKSFSRNAVRVHPFNIRGGQLGSYVMRGGVRL